MAFPPDVGARYQTREGRIWVVVIADVTGIARHVMLSTEGRGEIADQEVLEEEWDEFEASSTLL